MNSDKMPCPFCGDGHPECDTDSSRHAVRCLACQSGTSWFDSEDEAIAAWNTRMKLPPEPAASVLSATAKNEGLLEIGRRAIEAELVDWRDRRLSVIGRANGLVVREKDGAESFVIRFGPEVALRIGLLAIADAVGKLG